MLKMWEKKEYLFFFVLVPLALILIYLIPQSVKESHFILHCEKQQALNLFLSNYTHSDLQHLLNNLLLYLSLMLLIFKFETKKGNFYVSVLSIFLVLPWITSISTCLIKNIPPSQGSSGIFAGFAGYFLYVFYNYLKEKCKLKLSTHFVTMIFVLNAAIAMWMNGVYQPAILISSSLIFLIYYNKVSLLALFSFLSTKFKELKKENLKERLKIVFWISLMMPFLFLLPFLIPKNVIAGGSLTNTLAHYIGYIFGLFLPILLDLLKNL
ncbi:MAG: hypothetical protein OH319_01710 [Candidatus Parvarchaeota archaeon]|nr:hypothetical protein [Candidatus Jingweiarchaeum tengchongense]MCW1298085.1 hypothetical protein [Candidatus Jingweiarchaeum tengchongense]MCW1300800.1 hypothetical protein [Candidatus Jingweiarchaeum tengchongense]MCW1304933.1 hypothetical protein [Candidatus Jingweiarchaeum tengchongense]MCW1305507.1 hypothetical protein [Candidatus Jingweiarchaeum tengchongense]